MKLLIVEDKPEVIESLAQALADIKNQCACTFARSRDAAIDAIQKNVFDLAVLDLQILPDDAAIQPDISHGQAVYYELSARSPGTPIIFLTAFGTEDFISDLMLRSEQQDIWGSRDKYPMVYMLRKARLPEMVDLIKTLNTVIAETDQIEISSGIRPVALAELEKRVVRIFGRRHNGVRVGISALAGGLSGARVLGAKVLSAQDETRVYAAAKINELDKIADESRRYHEEVIRLAPGSFPTLFDQVSVGAGALGGLFYRLAEDYTSSLFKLLETDVERAAAVVGRLEALEKPWQESAPSRMLTVSEVRAMIVKEDFESMRDRLGAVGLERVDTMQVQVRMCCQHGDLHGGNVLLDKRDFPLLIDFAQVGSAPSVLDAITLEMSMLFHPDAKGLRSNWADAKVATYWPDLDRYVSAGPFGQFVKACRKWAFQVAGDRAVYATALAYSLKQMKYPDTDHDIAMALAAAAVNALCAT